MKCLVCDVEDASLGTILCLDCMVGATDEQVAEAGRKNVEGAEADAERLSERTEP